MADLKFIVAEVNKLLKTDYNLISFDSLPIANLVQILVDTLHDFGALTKVNWFLNGERGSEGERETILIDTCAVAISKVSTVNKYRMIDDGQRCDATGTHWPKSIAIKLQKNYWINVPKSIWNVICVMHNFSDTFDAGYAAISLTVHAEATNGIKAVAKWLPQNAKKE